MIYLYIGLVILLMLFWVVQLIDLMNMADQDLPGKNDKLAWAIILVFTSVLGALVFWVWKAGLQGERQALAEMRRTLPQPAAKPAADRGP